jgi:hypothetical protein
VLSASFDYRECKKKAKFPAAKGSNPRRKRMPSSSRKFASDNFLLLLLRLRLPLSKRRRTKRMNKLRIYIKILIYIFESAGGSKKNKNH